MKTVTIKNVEIGAGIPKICVPIVGKTKENILAQAHAITALPADLVEWRVDWFEASEDQRALLQLLPKLRETLGQLPLLATFRTREEGGEKAISPEDYDALCRLLIRSGCIDLLDLEIFRGDTLISGLIQTAHDADVKIVASNHDFHATPEKSEIIRRLLKMQDMDADILKIAVMPTCKKDVLTLLSATEEMQSQYADRPVITMSMGSQGLISRISGEVFGSALTFGAAGQASAPGQMYVEDLKTMLTLLHGAL